MKVSTVLKAIVGALAAGTAAAVPLIEDGGLSLADAIVILGAVLATFGVVWAVPNKTAA